MCVFYCNYEFIVKSGDIDVPVIMTDDDCEFVCGVTIGVVLVTFTVPEIC